MRILMLSRDSAGLKQDSATASRWRLLRDQGVEIDVVVMARDAGFWSDDGLRVWGGGGVNILQRYVRSRSKANEWVLASDMVTAQDPFELGLLACGISSKHSKPFEIQDHGGFFDGEAADEPLWPLRSRLAWWLARRAKAIRTVSPKSLENLKMKGLGDRAYWLPISADSRFSILTRTPEAGLVVSVGRLVSVKRFPLLLKSMVELKKIRPESRLAIIGDGPLRQSLEGMATQLGIKEAVDFVGQADPTPWLERAAVFTLLSSHEGWGVAAVEAASAGVPVVMSDTGCARWLEERGAATVIGKNEEAPKNIALRLSAAMTNGLSKASAPIQSLDGRQAAVEQVKVWSRTI